MYYLSNQHSFHSTKHGTAVAGPPSAMTDGASSVAGAAAASSVEDTLVDKEQVLASFASIDWGSYGRTTLGAKEVKILQACDEKPLDFLLADAGDAKLLVATLVKLLKAVSDATVQQYALTHIEEILQLEDLPEVRLRSVCCLRAASWWWWCCCLPLYHVCAVYHHTTNHKPTQPSTQPPSHAMPCHPCHRSGRRSSRRTARPSTRRPSYGPSRRATSTPRRQPPPSSRSSSRHVVVACSLCVALGWCVRMDWTDGAVHHHPSTSPTMTVD